MKGTMMSFETVQIAKTKIEAVVNQKEELI
jgi:hypothetical protein